ncbi:MULTISPECIES: DUF294 nucleotidyltransferase-like domain-containing protein [Bacillaceae]|uniref:DUF294 nucleotidyltransferase-like domain-containing protein n=1 Tax=Bacillaceae TaxID=186817 RepID=UPI002FFEF846
MSDKSFTDIRKWRDTHIITITTNHFLLNQFHDEVYSRVISLAEKQVEEVYGPPPCPFSFFVMGSAGRKEQSVWSDQDHGMIYQKDGDLEENYFLTLGKQISIGLNEVGYPFCDGKVMASNTLWCKSISQWEIQLLEWSQNSSWESIRNLLIFTDGRPLYGKSSLLTSLKNLLNERIINGNLLPRLTYNTQYHKKGIGVFGQFLTETHGPFSGQLNMKEICFFPYVNSARLLALKENVAETSTLSRLKMLYQIPNIDGIIHHFIKLLSYRLTYTIQTDYESGHYLPINNLLREQKLELKDIIKTGAAFLQYVTKVVVS